MSEEKTEEGRSPSFIVVLLKDFCFGCLAFVPLAVFAFVIFFLVKFVTEFGKAILGLTESVQTFAVICVLIVFILIYTGRKLRKRERWFLNFIEQWISRIPLVGGWYATIRDMVQIFATGGDKGYMGAVKVPCGNGYIIGFVTSRETLQNGSVQVTVFVPTSPNPTTGLVFFFPEEDVEYLNLTPEKAFTKVISLGIKS